MQTLDVVLAGLRGTLLAACSVSLSACPSSKCRNPKPVVEDGQPTGFVRCSDGAVNREEALDCPKLSFARGCRGDEDVRQCEADADCTEKPNGVCLTRTLSDGSRSHCGCVYPCTNDGDCGPDQACMCPYVETDGPQVASCVPADCKTNKDCESGQCGAIVHHDGCSTDMELACRGPNDECRSDETCPDDGCDVGYKCREATCKAGRPLTVDQEVRVADLVNRRWGETRLDGLTPSTEQAAYWLAVARMEHASVASFARFTNELLRFSAPPQLLAEALAAAADEIRHAEHTFAIASAYAGAPLGPGALRVDALCPTDDPELFVTRLITEGCVGETLGVAEILALLDGDLDPRLRPQLERIAADETRHAALAWKTLRWFAPRVDPAVLEQAFEQAIRSLELGDELGRQAIASVIEPCRSAALLS
jgi:hypothetical protein